MEDLERYGDYNDSDDDIPRKKSRVGLVLKILVGVVCLSVIGVIAFRLVLFNSYPASIKNIYFNDKLIAFYNEENGDIGAKTQELRSPYDNPDEGNFFCDNLILIPEIDQLQVSVRFNLSLIENLEKEYGVKLDDDPTAYRVVDGVRYYSKLKYKVQNPDPQFNLPITGNDGLFAAVVIGVALLGGAFALFLLSNIKRRKNRN